MKLERLGDIAKITSGGTPLTSKREFYDNGTIPWVKTGDLKVRHLEIIPDKISQLGLENSSAKIFPINTVLVAMYGATIGACSILKKEAATNQACAAILPTEKINEEFLFFFLASIKNDLINMGVGGGQPNISATILKDIKIPLPSLPIQKQIAKVLSQSENLITYRKASIELLDKYLSNIFFEMFGNPSNNSKKFHIGNIRDLVKEVKYGTSKPAETEGATPYIRMNNITPKGYMDFSNLKFINADDTEKEKYGVRKGDLLFNRTNSKELVGKTGVVNNDREMIIAGYLIRVRVNEKANPYYIWGFLNSPYGKKVLFNMCKAIVGMANINAQEFQDIKILIPTIGLQTQFEEVVLKAEILKEYFKDSLQELENLYGSLSQQAFKGELEFRNTSQKEIGDPFEGVEIPEGKLPSIADLDETKWIDVTEPPKIFSTDEVRDAYQQGIKEGKKKKKKLRMLSPFENVSSLATVTNYKPVLADMHPFIHKTFQEKHFTFDNLKQATVKAGWQYDFETLKNFVFELLRKGKLKQVFADAAFKSTFKKDETDAKTMKEVKDLTEQMYLQRAAVL